MNERTVLHCWEESHGRLPDVWRDRFCNLPVVASLCALPEPIALHCIRAHAELSDALELARCLLAEEATEDGAVAELAVSQPPETSKGGGGPKEHGSPRLVGGPGRIPAKVEQDLATELETAREKEPTGTNGALTEEAQTSEHPDELGESERPRHRGSPVQHDDERFGLPPNVQKRADSLSAEQIENPPGLEPLRDGEFYLVEKAGLIEGPSDDLGDAVTNDFGRGSSACIQCHLIFPTAHYEYRWGKSIRLAKRCRDCRYEDRESA